MWYKRCRSVQLEPQTRKRTCEQKMAAEATKAAATRAVPGQEGPGTAEEPCPGWAPQEGRGGGLAPAARQASRAGRPGMARQQGHREGEKTSHGRRRSARVEVVSRVGPQKRGAWHGQHDDRGEEWQEGSQCVQRGQSPSGYQCVCTC